MTTCILSHLLAKYEIQEAFSVIIWISDSPKRTLVHDIVNNLQWDLEDQLSEIILCLYEFFTCNYLRV